MLPKLYLMPLLAIPLAGALQAQTITVYPGPATIAVGTTRSLSAYVPLSPNTIQWSINDVVGGNSTYGTITSGGVYTAPMVPPAANTITVKATSTAYPTKFGTGTITITQLVPWVWSSYPSTFPAGEVNLSINGSNFLPTTVMTLNDVPLPTTYVNATSIKIKATIPATMVGKALLRATQPAPGAVKSDPITVTITAPPAVTVSVAPATAALSLGATRQFTATVANSSNTGVTWAVNNVSGGNAMVGTISAAGLYTAPMALPSPATVTVSATSMASATAKGSAVVTLSSGPPVSVTITPTSSAVSLGATRQFAATVANSSNMAVTWTVNGITGGNSTVGTVSASGLYAAPAALPTPATVTVRATSVASPSAYADAQVTLSAGPPVTVTVSPTAATVSTGNTQAFAATVTNSANTAVTWSVNGVAGGNSTVGTIGSSGLYTAPAVAPSPSIVTITAASLASPTAQATASVTIQAPAPVALPNLSHARFLEQAAFGPTASDLQQVGQLGYSAWIDQQFAMAETPFNVGADVNVARANWLWRMAHAPDQLRQRVVAALAKIIVISANKNIYANEIVPYYQTLSRNAFGNYRTLLGEITISPQMGKYLDLANSTKPGTGSGANENYPRELLQLFSMGLVKLNPDGTPVPNSPSYTQADVAQLARALTGWTYPTAPGGAPGMNNWENFSGNMEARENNHDTTAKSFLGCAIPSGKTVAVETGLALDCIFAHANVGPFIALRLIRDLVTSNPSAAYVGRVAAAFNDNGQGIRGDMKAVVKAILLDPEARNDVAPADSGRLKDPHYHFASFVRQLNGQVSPAIQLSYLFDQMGQMPLTPPSVFAFYSALYRIPRVPLNGPEFQIYTPTESVLRANFFYSILTNQGGSDVSVDLAPFQAVAGNITSLIDTVDAKLLYGRMPATMKQSIAKALATASDNNQRVVTALYLTVLSGQYAVQF